MVARMVEQNWAGNYRYTASAIRLPESVDEVRRIVGSAPKVKALGTRHSFNAVADTSGELVHLGRLEPRIEIAADRSSVTVSSATPYRLVAQALQAEGLALHNLGSLPHISVGGACSTGTHGSGDHNANLSWAVIGLELVTADGSLLAIDRTDPRFDGMVVSLGALGIITSLTLRVQPTFDVRQDVYLGLPWQNLLDHFDEITGSGFSVNIFTRWGEGEPGAKVWVKTLMDAHAEPARADVFGAQLQVSDEAAHASTGLTNSTAGGIPGPWNELLPHFRGDVPPGYGEEIQTEYMIDRRDAVPAMLALRSIAEVVDPVLFQSELRTIAADGMWLSPANGRETLGIHFTFRPDPQGVAAALPVIEQALAPFDARPHWGKLFDMGAPRIGELYERMGDFRALAIELDPDAKFHNEFLEKHVYSR